MSATQEILEQFKPKLCPHSIADTTNGMQYLELFLPVIMKPENAQFGYQLWFQEFMQFWEEFQNASTWENVRKKRLALQTGC